MAFVIDASLVVAWLLPDENNRLAEYLMARLEFEDGFAADLLWHEVRNVLLVAARRGRIPAEKVNVLLHRLQATPLKNAGPGDSDEIVRLAQRWNLSGYDAAYLALAVATGLPFATDDKRLALAAEGEGSPLIAIPSA